MTLTINKSGDFTLRVLGPNHCGTENPLNIRFTAKLRAGGDELDTRGFLFDQLDIPKYFSSISSTRLSCEKFAERSVADLRRMAERENPSLHVEYVYLSFSPSPYTATIECEWSHDRTRRASS